MTNSKTSQVLFLTIGNGINILINFLMLPYLVRAMSYEDYGSYGQVLIVTGFLQTIFTFNLNQVSNLYLAKYQDSIRNVFSTLMRISGLLALLSVVILFLSAPILEYSFSNPKIDNLLFLSFLFMFTQVPIPVLMSVLIFLGKAKQQTKLLIISNLIKVAFIFIAIQFYNSVEILVIGIGIAGLIQLLMFYFSIPPEVRNVNQMDKKLRKEILGTAAPLTLSSVVERSVFFIDGVMISSLLSTTDYAIYRAGAFEVPFVAGLYGSISAIVMPEVARLFMGNNKAEIIRLKKKAIIHSAFIIYPILVFLLFFSQPLVQSYLTENYAKSALVFSIFNLSLLIRINDFQDVIVIAGKTKFIFYNIVWLVILNLGLNYFFIKHFGIAGSAAAFIVFLFVFAYILAKKQSQILNCRLHDLFDVISFLKILSIAIILCCMVHLMYTFWMTNVWFLVFVSPFYLLASYLIIYKVRIIEVDLINKLVLKIPVLNKLFK